jgi:CBS domain-containing protein
MKMTEVLQQKQAGIQTAIPTMTLQDAIRKMCDHKIGALLVEDQGQPVGILTERDVLRFCAEHADRLGQTLVGQVMQQDLIVATPNSSVAEGLSIMTNHRVRHLPVVENNRIVGMVSIGDLVKSQLEETEVEAKYLRDYINL